MTEHKCQVETYRGGTMISGIGAYSPCGKKATVQLPSGEWVCRYHSPEAITKREQTRAEHFALNKYNRDKGIGHHRRQSR